MALLFTLAVVISLGALAAVRYSIVFPRQPFCGPLPPLTSDLKDLVHRLNAHVSSIASMPHNLEHEPALEAAATYIETSLSQLGYRPSAQVYEADGRQVRNIEITLGPDGEGNGVPCYVVGAHYDSAGESPGAHDNGTGVAAVLELARLLRDHVPREHKLRLVLFVNEEQPYGKTPDMGSWRHAERLKKSGEQVLGMIALETIGYFSDEPYSQEFPPPFGLVYPNTGNFIAFVALPGARTFLHRALGAFRKHAPFPSIGGIAPGFLEGIDLSDHWAYHQFGFPSLMITDTAPFRNPYYHETDDLPDTVDYESLARITQGLERMLREIVA
jgi:hypothetical protein